MNRIQRITAAAALGTAVLAPTAAAVAYAEPYPGHQSEGTSQPAGLSKSKAQIEHEELLGLSKSKAQIEHEELLGLREQSSVVDEPAATTTDATIPWDVVGLAVFVGAALAAGAVVGIRHVQRPEHA